MTSFGRQSDVWTMFMAIATSFALARRSRVIARPQSSLWMSQAQIDSSVLRRVGSTPLLELKRIVPEDAARILIKLEGANPTGSMKDRMALAMIEGAERT